MYLLDIESLNHLLAMIKETLETEENTEAQNCAGSDVFPELLLAMTLRYLVGGSV